MLDALAVKAGALAAGGEVSAWGAALAKGAVLSLVGLVVGVGQILASREPVTLRVAVGRCLTTAGLAVGAGAAMTWTNLDPLALVGLAACVSSLGTSGLERIAQRALGGGASKE